MAHQCYQCGRPAVMAYKQKDGSNVPFCVDCATKLERMCADKHRMLAETNNFLMDQMAFSMGIPPMGPRFPQQVGPIVHTGDVTLNNIDVSKSNIGVLNTGQIETIDSAVGYLSRGDTQEIATALKAITEAVIKSTEATKGQKDEVLELLSLLSTEAANPPGKRKSKGIQPIIRQTTSILSGLSALSQLWSKYVPTIRGFFGL